MFCGFKTQCFRGEVKTQCFGGLKTVFLGLKTVFFGFTGLSKESRYPPRGVGGVSSGISGNKPMFQEILGK